MIRNCIDCGKEFDNRGKSVRCEVHRAEYDTQIRSERMKLKNQETRESLEIKNRGLGLKRPKR